MKFIGNFSDWINPLWVDEILSLRGDGRPMEGQKPNSPTMIEEYKKSIEAGYREDVVYFWMFNSKNLSFDPGSLPWTTDNYHWWVTKMYPGQFMPMHVDPHTTYEKNSKRYWIPLQDWESGHIFMYENKVITDYKKGDVWQYKDSKALHGAANIGHTPRLVLQVSTHE
jgi:hypothetical protein